jgi:hypothetical protein
MPRRRRKPHGSTFGAYRPGVGYTITRANIEKARRECAKAGKDMPTAEEIVINFVCRGDKIPPSPRHLARAQRLIDGRGNHAARD